MAQIEGKTVQAAFAAAFSALTCYLDTVAVPIVLLLIAIIIDYVTGMISAWHKAELSSKKGVFGIVKKVSYLGLVCVGMVVDWSVMYWLSSFGAGGDAYKFSFGALVAFWLTMNELISILENLEALKVPVPKFLTKVVKRLKVAAEKTAETAEKENDKESEEKKDEKGN